MKTLFRNKPVRVYATTHQFLTNKLAPMPKEKVVFLSSKPHQIRKIQDQFCYIHAKSNGHKILSAKNHKALEKKISSNLKLFHLAYIPLIPNARLQKHMIDEATIQQNMLRSSPPIQVISARFHNINFFLSYSYSRAKDYYDTITCND